MRLGGKLKSVIRSEKDHVDFAEEGVEHLQEPTCCVRFINHVLARRCPVMLERRQAFAPKIRTSLVSFDAIL